MNTKNKKISVMIPCFNEEKGIREVILGLPYRALALQGYDVEVIVVDNASTDNTNAVARASGATVVVESRKGKGHAIRRGFGAVSSDTDYVVMLDGDNTYDSGEILRMVEPLASGFAEVVIGSRLTGKIKNGSMKKMNHFGNWAYSQLVRMVYHAKVTDVLTGYFAWNKNVVDVLAPRLRAEGFAIEMEMITKMARMGVDMYSVPITYHVRRGESNLHPIRDGLRIMRMFIASLFWTPDIRMWDIREPQHSFRP